MQTHSTELKYVTRINVLIVGTNIKSNYSNVYNFEKSKVPFERNLKTGLIFITLT